MRKPMTVTTGSRITPTVFSQDWVVLFGAGNLCCFDFMNIPPIVFERIGYVETLLGAD
jgi:hypothetical protein